MESFIPWIGGKRLLRNTIIEQFPENIGNYVEVFGGAGWVLFAKEKHAEKEVFNDIDGNLINLYRCIKYHASELQRTLEGLPNSRELFLNFRDEMNHKGLTDIQRAARFYYLIKVSFGADRKTYGVKSKLLGKGIACFTEVQKRLDRVIIENLDFERVIKTYDRENTLFYLDPPYMGAEKYYKFPFPMEEHVRLRDRLSQIKGKFLLSYNDDPRVVELYNGFKMVRASRQNNLLTKGNSMENYKELLILNY